MADTSQLLKRVSVNFSESNPYARIQRKGSFFTPVEAGNADDDDQESEDFSVQSIPEESTVGDVSPGEGGQMGDAHSVTSHKYSTGKDRKNILHVQVFGDTFSSPKHCTKEGKLKPRRGVPHIRASDLVKGLTKNADGEWIFEGQLNEWPAFTNYCLKSLTSISDYRVYKKVNRLWNAGDGKPLPDAKSLPQETRATFVAPSWSEHGWAPDSPGFVYWYSTQHSQPRCLFGEAMLHRLEEDKHANSHATMVHTFAHRYPVAKESLEDRNTCHVGVFIEWEHKRFGTIAELAWRNGAGGYGGRANWIPDKLEPETQLFRSMAPALKKPWSNKQTEIRMYDIDAKDKAEFEAFMAEHSEKQKPLEEQRFLDPVVAASAPVRVRRVDSAALAGYVLNYIQRAAEYDKFLTNCQTFGADIFAFLTGTKGVQPFHKLCQVGYKQRTMSFMYAPRYEDEK